MKTLSIVTITACLTLALCFTATACHIDSVDLDADCYGYSITGSVTCGDVVTYSLLVNGENVFPEGERTMQLEDTQINIFGSWEAPCGDVTVEGEIKVGYYDKDGNIAYFEPTETLGESFDCPCDEETCDPRTQGFWRRICEGATGLKPLHPETPDGFDTSECGPLLIKGTERRNPCVRAGSQYSALQYNLMYGYLSEGCEVDLAGYENAGEVADAVGSMIPENCKAASDLAEAVNSGDAL